VRARIEVAEAEGVHVEGHAIGAMLAP
jgi:hypothetical protein